jgi:hypothetical protein
MSYLRYLRLFVYSGVQHTLCCVFVVFFCRLVYPMFLVSLDCLFCFIALRYSLTFICPVSCVPYVASFSGLSIFVLPFGIL